MNFYMKKMITILLALVIAGGSTMTITSLPWANTTPGDAGPYSDTDWATMYKVLFGADEDMRGVIPNTENDAFAVTQRAAGANMSVDVAVGQALINGRVAHSNAIENMTIATADATLDRIDYVVLRTDATNQITEVVVKTGTPAAFPSIPALDITGSPYFEIPLALVNVGAAVSSITDSVINDTRSFATVPDRVYTPVTNQSGSTLLPGYVVIWDNANEQSVTTTTTEDDPLVAGVVADYIEAAGTGRICVLGVMPILLDGAASIGDDVGTSTAAKIGTTGASNSIGRVMETLAGAGVVPCFIAPPATAAASSLADEQFQQALGNNSLSSTTWANMTTVDVKVDITTAGGDVEVSASIPLIAGSSGSGATTIYFDIEVDGTRISNNQYGMVTVYWDGAYTSVGTAVISQFRVGSLSAGSHTIRVKYRRESGSAMTPQTAALTFATLYAKEVN